MLDWWVNETDLRGYDDRIGSIHAVAHGADALGALRFFRHAPASRLLAAVGERLTTATDFVWRDQEDDRIAGALCSIVYAGDCDLAPLLEPIESMVAAGSPGPVPRAASNTMRSLRSFYVALGNPAFLPNSPEPQRIPDAERLQSDVAAALQLVTPWLFRATRS